LASPLVAAAATMAAERCTLPPTPAARRRVRLLLDRGAAIDARDSTWNDTPLGWAIVGSWERPTTSRDPDWIATVRTLIEAGASTEGITLSPDDPKPPSPEVAQLLRDHGIGNQ
jgi:hypothetical protein